MANTKKKEENEEQTIHHSPTSLRPLIPVRRARRPRAEPAPQHGHVQVGEAATLLQSRRQPGRARGAAHLGQRAVHDDGRRARVGRGFQHGFHGSVVALQHVGGDVVRVFDGAVERAFFLCDVAGGGVACV